MHEYAIRFFALLARSSKLQIMDTKLAITVASFSNMDEENRNRVMDSLQLPDDILNDILEEEKVDDISKISEVLKE